MSIAALKKQTDFNQDFEFRCLEGKYQDLFFNQVSNRTNSKQEKIRIPCLPTCHLSNIFSLLVCWGISWLSGKGQIRKQGLNKPGQCWHNSNWRGPRPNSRHAFEDWYALQQVSLVKFSMIFKLADRMRSTRTNGASKNRDYPAQKWSHWQNWKNLKVHKYPNYFWYLLYVYLRVPNVVADHGFEFSG